MIFVIRLLRVEARFPLFVIAYNWSSILIMAMQMVPVILLSLGAPVVGFVSIVLFAVYAGALYYRLYVAQMALDTTASMAWALVLGDLALSIAITKLIG